MKRVFYTRLLLRTVGPVVRLGFFYSRNAEPIVQLVWGNRQDYYDSIERAPVTSGAELTY